MSNNKNTKKKEALLNTKRTNIVYEAVSELVNIRDQLSCIAEHLVENEEYSSNVANELLTLGTRITKLSPKIRRYSNEAIQKRKKTALKSKVCKAFYSEWVKNKKNTSWLEKYTTTCESRYRPYEMRAHDIGIHLEYEGKNLFQASWYLSLSRNSDRHRKFKVLMPNSRWYKSHGFDEVLENGLLPAADNPNDII